MSEVRRLLYKVAIDIAMDVEDAMELLNEHNLETWSAAAKNKLAQLDQYDPINSTQAQKITLQMVEMFWRLKHES